MYHVMSRGDRREDIFLDDVDRRMAAAEEETFRVLRRGGCLGSGAFKQERLAPMEGRLGEHHSGELRLESAEAKAERILGAELARLIWTEPELALRRKSDPDKLRIAARLRRQTTLSVKAIAARMRLCTSRSANARLHQWMSESSTLALNNHDSNEKTNHAMV